MVDIQSEMTAYNFLKFAHISFVAISGSLFVYRYLLLNLRAERPLPRALKVLPHVNDSLLLACAIGMLFISQMNPFATPWLLAKIVALLIYIGLGAMCMRATPGSRRQTVSFVVSIAVFGYILLVAVTKQAILGSLL